MFSLYKTPLFLISTILIGFFLIRPEYTAIQEVEARGEDYTRALAQVKDYTQTLNLRRSSIDSIPAQDIAKLNRIVDADGIDAAQVLEDLTALAERTGLLVDSVNTTGDAHIRDSGQRAATSQISERDFYTLETSLSLRGSYEEMKRYVDALERSLTPYEVVSVRFDVGSAGANLIDFSLLVRTWSLIPKTEF